MKLNKILKVIFFIFLILILYTALFWETGFTINIPLNEIAEDIMAFFKGGYAISFSNLKIEDLPNDKVVFGRLDINKISYTEENFTNITYKIYSVTYKDEDLKELFSTKVDATFSRWSDGFIFEAPHFVMSPNKKFVLIMAWHYNEKMRIYEKEFYIANVDGSNLQLIHPKVIDNIPPSEILDLKWDTNNAAYFTAGYQWFYYNPETQQKDLVQSFGNKTFVFYSSGGTESEFQPKGLQGNPNERSLATLSPQKDLIVYLIRRHKVSTSVWGESDLPYLAVAKPDGSKEKRLTRVPIGIDYIEWTKDGKFLIFGKKNCIVGHNPEIDYTTDFLVFRKESTCYAIIPSDGVESIPIIVKAWV